MSDVYRHGTYVEELATSVQAMTQVTQPAVFFGTAPVHLASNAAESNKPMMCASMSEFVAYFGWSDDFAKYTLCEAAQVCFQLYSVAPVIFVNVLDATKHGKQAAATVEGVSAAIKISAPIILPTLKVSTGAKPVTASILGVQSTEPITIPAAIDATNFKVAAGDEELTVGDDYTVGSGTITLTDAGLAKVDGALTFTSGVDTFAELIADTDYTAAFNSSGEVVLTIVNTGKVVDDKISLSYTELDASLVTASDIVGGVDIATGKNTGIEVVEEIYSRFGLVPGTLAAPGFSTNSAVAAMLHAKAWAVNGVFKSIAVADIDTATTRTYNEVNTIKASKNYTDPFLIACWPQVALNGVRYNLSTHVAALMGRVDAEHGGIPYKSPSNEGLNIDEAVLSDGTEVSLGRAQGNYLNGQGVVTALNFAGWRLWGNRTSAYPGNVDVKDSFIACRRMMNWLANSIIVNFLSQIDQPISKRRVEDAIERINRWLEGLRSSGAMLGGRMEFLESENPTTSLVDGVAVFHLYVGLMPPMREADIRIEVDVNYLATLFG